MYAKTFIQGSHNVPSYGPVTNEAYITKELVEMCLTIRKSVLLVMTIPVKWFLAFRTTEMVDVPLFADGVHDTFVFDRLLASATDGYSQFIVTSKTIQFIVTFTTSLVKFTTTLITIVMPWMDRITHINDVFPFFNICVTFVTHESTTFRLLVGVTTLAQCSSSVFDETSIS